MKIKNYNEFSHLPFDELSEAVKSEELSEEEAIKEFVESTGAMAKTKWFMPQLVAHIAKWSLVRDDSKKYSPKLMLASNLTNNAFNQGIYYLCRSKLRGALVSGQTKEPAVQYSALVPLMLMPFKKLHNIDYSSWKRDELKYVLDPNLLEAINYTHDEEYSRETLLAMRDEGLTTKTGPNAGTIKSSLSTIRLSGSAFKNMPWYYQVMKFQIWCAHPSARHQYMILDPENLDSMPEPLVNVNVLPKQKPIVREPMPWE